jgi:putative hydrolase of the HAD superfamily
MTDRFFTRIAAVTFDVGGTLIEPWPSVGRIYAEVADRVGIGPLDPARLDERFGTAWRSAHVSPRGFDHSRTAWAALVETTFHGLTERAGDPGLFEALWRRFIEPDAWRVFPDVHPCFEELRARGLRLAALSNWDERLHPLLAGLGLAGAFEFSVASAEIGAHKPAPEAFAHVTRRFGLPPSALLHVGDSEREDVAGARSAGWSAVRVDRRNPAHEGSLASLAELPSRLVMDRIS